MIIYFYKLVFVAAFALVGYTYPPFFAANRMTGAFIGAAIAIFLSLLSVKLKKTDLKNIWGAAIGIIGGVIVGWVSFKMLGYFLISWGDITFFKAVFLIGLPITGLFVGLQRPTLFSPLNIKEFFRGSSAFTQSYLLDTSAIIDGRIVPIALSGFIEGELIITQFVLAELQFIADSSDSNKKIRGKRGLDVIEQLQNNKSISVTILNKNVSGVKDVDQKLVLLAKDYNFKIITNDVNLSRIAKLQDVKVLNVNELAFAIKPIVYPGEKLSIHITKEGKEKKQGVGYLEDGTMVIIDDARNDIGRDLEVEVTSVLQSTSGKMIFARKI